MRQRLAAELGALALAGQFLTRLPLPAPRGPVPMRAALRYLPLVGAVIGACGAAVLAAAAQVLPAVPAVLLSIMATAALTGALHEDGLADTLDGIGGRDAERALAIMRDSRIGVFGALGLGLVVALKASALVAMPLALAAAVLVAGATASRFCCVLVTATSRYVRPDGTAAFAASGPGARGLALAAATAGLAIALVLAVGGLGAALAGSLGLAAGHLVAQSDFERRLGGYTGDCLGATQQLSEVGFALGVLAWL